MSAVVIVAAIVAGALGAVTRYGVTRLVARRAPHALTRAVLIVNIAGSLIAGALIAVDGDLRYVLVSGFAGGLTTFSTWSVESIQLVMAGRTSAAVRNVLINLIAGLVAGLAAFTAATFVLAALGL